MRFSLTGDQPDAALFVQSIIRSTEHTVGAVHLHGALEDRLKSQFPVGAQRVASPEEVLIAADTDAVIVAESQADESIRLVRHASQADCHVVVIPPNDLSTAYSYEIHLLLDESQRGIVVLTGSWYLPETDSVDMAIDDCQLGLPAIADDSVAAATLMHAIDACSALGFANSQVTVLGIDHEGTLEASCRIVLSGCGADGGTRPAITLNRSRSADLCRLQGKNAQQSVDQPITMPGQTTTLPDDIALLLCSRVTHSLPDDVACQAAMEQFSRTLQIAGAVDKSVRRRRTVDVYVDELTERSVFKTQMTAIGCGVLTWLMLGMIGYLLVGQLLKPPVTVLHLMRTLWIAPVVIFLLAQFLLPIARGRQRASQSTHEEQTSRHDKQNTDSHPG